MSVAEIVLEIWPLTHGLEGGAVTRWSCREHALFLKSERTWCKLDAGAWMERRATEDFFCSLCNSSFSFKSKYERHLEGSKHIQFASVFDTPTSCVDSRPDHDMHSDSFIGTEGDGEAIDDELAVVQNVSYIISLILFMHKLKEQHISQNDDEESVAMMTVDDTCNEMNIPSSDDSSSDDEGVESGISHS